MPLRDHFHAPLNEQHSWDALHAVWPTTIVMALKAKLPRGFVAQPGVKIATGPEIDVIAFDRISSAVHLPTSDGDDGGVAVWAPPKPTLDIVADLPDQDEYEVRIYDITRNRRLVAAIELVSPSNKDRPETRLGFVGKCASLLRQRVSVAIIDVVTDRQANLYSELLECIGQEDPALGSDAPAIYASACRWASHKNPARLQTWTHALEIGKPLPTLPIWLTPDLAVPLELEPTYEQACDIVSIT